MTAPATLLHISSCRYTKTKANLKGKNGVIITVYSRRNCSLNTEHTIIVDE